MQIKSLLIVASVVAIISMTAQAGSQQDKMKSCNAEATQKQLKGDDRKTFMKTCLSAKPEAVTQHVTQQEKMKACNADAGTKGLKGDDRKKFMSQCLSSKPAA